MLTGRMAHRLVIYCIVCSLSEPVTICPDKFYHLHRSKLRIVNVITFAANATQRNLANRGRQRNNTSGCKGVTWDKARRKWLSPIQVQGRQIFLGRFTQRQQAFCVYQAAARRSLPPIHL